MQFSINLVLSSLFLLSGITSAQNSTAANNHSIRCLRFPPAVGGNATFNPDAILALSTAISDNSYNPPLDKDGIKLRAGHSSRIGWAGNGGYQICLQNFYFFTSVTVPLKEISEAVAQIESTCCEGAGRQAVPGVGGRLGKCQDSKGLVKAVDGSMIKIVGQNYGERCCGMFSC